MKHEFQYAVVYRDSYYVEGDERSRTNPGHGYPGHTIYYENFLGFPTREELQIWLERGPTNPRPREFPQEFRVYALTPLHVTTKVVVELHP